MHLVELVRVGEQLVVVDLHDERDLVRVAPRRHAEHAERRRDRVAAALDRELRRCSSGRSTPGSARTTPPPSARCPGRRAGSTRSRCPPRRPWPSSAPRLRTHRGAAVGVDEDSVDVVGARQRELVAWDGLGRVAEQRLGLITEEGCDVGHAASVPLGLGAGAIRRPSPARRDRLVDGLGLAVSTTAVATTSVRLWVAPPARKKRRGPCP